ncbi:oxygen-independent coproporphyrinogen-3 oxidase [Lacinutrix venerupis]|uniref:oxygen-independent coproporphyrinogen III oxidase n=1 Tax=Lacinutrix venerupis TaxID=1486034 RepID=UPI000EB11BFA|nr:oxygen-independent coproporphyrinogen III oxidase [Lacinutrix venerupis]RLJ68657.1 oxygen-independent coproporphyrinogen-3 oxidase [Lacinutrix venerupis]
MNSSLIAKYNVAGPRYTSYPTVPYWDNNSFSLKRWKASLKKSFDETNSTNGVSLYIHLPFCESMCTFCGCHKRITKNHNVEIPYIESLIAEFKLYKDFLGETPNIKELHIGGGTPTFFKPENITVLLNAISRIGKFSNYCELSFEGHPNNTTKEHLKMFASFKFTRVSYGVQDYNLKVQKAIHRIQPFENVKNVTEYSRAEGFTSIGHDIIFGLPYQTIEDVINTINKAITLMPERIAFYSYAHVPWIKGNGQRGYNEKDLPTATQKRLQYEKGKQMLLEAGYFEIGMDHFSLSTDSLYQAHKNKKLHRNFMGYTVTNTKVMIGLGASAISDSWYGFAQNEKGVESYKSLVNEGVIPVFRGHILNEEDLIIRKHILNLMCKFETSWNDATLCFNELPDVLIKLKELEKDGLIKIEAKSIYVTEKGKPFVRNVCLPFDRRLQRNKPETQVFSMTV